MERSQLQEIVEYSYAALDQNTSEQTINMSIDYIEKHITNGMTVENVQDIISAALDTTENKKLNPKWFGDVMRNSKAGFNKAQEDVETSRPAPVSNGSFELDQKCCFMSMWAQIFFTTFLKEQHAVISDWGSQYRFLVKHGLMDEPEGWKDTWIRKAKEYIKAKELANGTLQDVINSRKAITEALDNNVTVMDTVYKMRVKELLYRSQRYQPDDFSNRFNAKTPELPPVFVIQDNSKYHFHLFINQ